MACAGVQQPREKLGDSPGALLFNGYTKADVLCFTCHNGDGKGAMRGPPLATPMADMSEEQLVDAIKNGTNWMPAQKDHVSDEEIGQILAWLHTSFPAAPKP